MSSRLCLPCLPPDEDFNRSICGHIADFRDILTYLDARKNMLGARSEDLLLAFFDGVLEAREAGLTNLFMAGSRYDEPTPCTGVISLGFLSWEF